MEEKCLIQPSQQLDKYTYITFLHDRISKNNDWCEEKGFTGKGSSK